MNTSCLACGALIPVGARKSRCATCRSKHEARYEYERARQPERSRAAYKTPGYQAARRIALNRAAHACQTQGCGTNQDLTVHHLDHNTGNNTQDNLLVLCRRHHAMLEATERRAGSR